MLVCLPSICSAVQTCTTINTKYAEHRDKPWKQIWGMHTFKITFSDEENILYQILYQQICSDIYYEDLFSERDTRKRIFRVKRHSFSKQSLQALSFYSKYVFTYITLDLHLQKSTHIGFSYVLSEMLSLLLNAMLKVCVPSMFTFYVFVSLWYGRDNELTKV